MVKERKHIHNIEQATKHLLVLYTGNVSFGIRLSLWCKSESKKTLGAVGLRVEH